MTSSNPNSPTNSPLNFRPFAIGKRGQKFRFIPTNSVGLSKPTITQALQTGGDAIQVTWGESGGTSYALQVSTDGGTTFDDVTTTAGTSFTHTGLSFPGSYTYRVRATVDAEVSDWSDSVTETMVDVPAAPGGLTVTGATTSSISLSWNDTADEGSYLVEVSVDGLGSWTSAGSTNQNVVTFTHSGLAESVQRHYRVTAFNKAGGGIPSSTTNSWTIPAAPTGLTATATSSTQINLAWTDVSTGNQSYKVERSTDNVNWTEIATGLSATATTYSAVSLNASTLYYFRVRAANAARNSAYSGTASATTQAGGIPAATFDLNFTTDPYVGTRFSRASRGTFVNSSGFIQAAETNLALYSGQLNNSYWTTGSETITVNAAVAPDGTSTAARHTESSATNFHGMQRSSVAGVTAGSPHTFSIYVKRDPTSPSVRNVSLWLYYDLSATPNSSRNAVLFNTATGAYINQSTFNSSGVSYGSEDVGNGWFRYWVTVTAPATATGMRCGIYMFQDGTTTLTDYRAETYAGNGSSVLYWGPQLVASASRLPYVHTAASAVGTPRITHDPVTLAPLGLLMEAQATNLCLQSETADVATGTAATVNTATSPANTLTADTLTETAGTGFHHGTKVFTSSFVAGTRYTASVFVKNPAGSRNGFFYMTVDFGGGTATGYAATFNIANGTLGGAGSTASRGNPSGSHGIENYGNGWYRIWVSATSDATNTNAQIYYGGTPSMTPTWFANYIQYAVTAGDEKSIANMWGFQIETGSTATSYIPTTTATVTRSGDIYGFFATEVASFWNASAGSVAMNWQRAGRESQTPAAKFGFAVSGNQYMRLNMSGGASPSIANGGSNTVSTVTGHTTTPNIGVPMKSGFSYDSAPNFKGFVNGTAGTNITSVSIPTVNKIEFATQVGDFMQSGYTVAAFGDLVIGRLRYWNTKLSDADMQTATT